MNIYKEKIYYYGKLYKDQKLDSYLYKLNKYKNKLYGGNRNMDCDKITDEVTDMLKNLLGTDKETAIININIKK